jgi:hypothetical protein
MGSPVAVIYSHANDSSSSSSSSSYSKSADFEYEDDDEDDYEQDYSGVSDVFGQNGAERRAVDYTCH